MASLNYWRYPGLLRVLRRAYRARVWYRERQPALHRAWEHRSNFYEQVWREAASQLGASVTPLGNDILEIRCGEACTRVRRNSTPIDDLVTLAVALYKPLVHRLLAQRGLRVPTHLEFTIPDVAKAITLLESNGGEWVVKPAGSSAGSGVTTGINTGSDLARAAAAAAAYGSSLLLEQQVAGDVFRLLYLEGKLLDAILRKPPTVVADGRSTLRKLVSLENEARLRAGTNNAEALISLDLDVSQTLQKQGFSLSSVPKEGTAVKLKTVINENSGSENVPALNLLCESIIEDGAAAVSAVGARLAGVDVVTPDAGMSLARSRGVILEVNTPPGYQYHYHRQGGRSAIAVPILEHLLRIGQNDEHFASERVNLKP